MILPTEELRRARAGGISDTLRCDDETTDDGWGEGERWRPVGEEGVGGAIGVSRGDERRPARDASFSSSVNAVR